MTKLQLTRLIFVLLFLASVVLAYLEWIPWLICFMVPIFFIGLMFLFSMNIGYNSFLEAVNEMPNDKVMLTFDDGPHPKHTEKILDILKEHQVKAFFFMIGEHAKKEVDLVERIVREGHRIGGHSYHHFKWFGLLGKKSLELEIMSAQELLTTLTKQQVNWFRPPFGVTNPNVSTCVNSNGLKVMGWNVRSYDTAISDSARLEKSVCKKLAPGSIVLLHDRLRQTVEALPGIITYAKNKGLKFDVISEN